MAWTDRGSLAARDVAQATHPGPLDEFLVSGGDGRLSLSDAGENAYGCTPFPAPGLIDFASSTASSISEEAYARARVARDELLTRSLHQGPDAACEAAVTAARASLLGLLQIEDAEVVFSASGTDAQLQTLYMVRLLHPGRLACVIAGADQTGSGTAHTCHGRHFSHTTSTGAAVEKGAPIAGLDGVTGMEITFRKADGGFRRGAEMDDAVLAAVEQALASHDHVLLQTMEASKFGWQAPSDTRLDEIATRFAGRVTIVADACQLRIGRRRLKALLARGAMVLVTGSKFFTGPAFSGAVLVPHALAGRLAGIKAPAGHLAGYASRFDWPGAWSLRNRFSHRFNFGQWLRWEAALEEMRLFYAVPRDFRDQVTRIFAEEIQQLVGGARHLAFVAGGEDFAPCHATIFALRLMRDADALPAAACAEIHRAMRRDLSALSPSRADVLRMSCQIGQPVALAHGTAALRLSLSARIVRDCWSPDPARATRNIAALRDDLCLAVKKLDLLAWLYPLSRYTRA